LVPWTIINNPDFQNTFPPHCLAGTSGQKKVPETQPQNPLWIDVDTPNDLISRVQNHNGEIIFRKQQFDVFTNPNVDPILEAVNPDRIVVYGVALDVCNAYAINGFLKRNTAAIQLALDATQAIIPERGEKLVSDWQIQGVEITTTETIINQ
jgi:nicotinamidase-related amidase